MSKNIVNFFDPSDADHVEAYAHLRETGSWPESFCDEIEKQKLEFTPSYILAIESKIAGAFVKIHQYLQTSQA